ncbi:hypothetical protein EMPG_12407 [Blastomyces silverae]|uniref:Uncharacterized protein n=1 Tax=Blastomyces silverae TaxID=2060906 RepID=A0A0H1BM34_9EURO|nr:hypothetical protein EMPG_12407 [Blastomyces silverae]
MQFSSSRNVLRGFGSPLESITWVTIRSHSHPSRLITLTWQQPQEAALESCTSQYLDKRKYPFNCWLTFQDASARALTAYHELYMAMGSTRHPFPPPLMLPTPRLNDGNAVTEKVFMQIQKTGIF